MKRTIHFTILSIAVLGAFSIFLGILMALVNPDQWHYIGFWLFHAGVAAMLIGILTIPKIGKWRWGESGEEREG